MQLGKAHTGKTPAELTAICQQACKARCCRGAYLIMLDGEEAVRVEALAASRGLRLPIHREENRIWWRNDECDSGACPFLGADNLCSIYDQRPAGCRSYPKQYSPGCQISGWTSEDKILVASVHGRAMPFEFIGMRDTIMAHLARYDLLAGATNVSGVRVDDNRNKCVEHLLASDARYLLFLDDDMVFPTDLGSRLVGHQKDIVCGLYFQRQPGAVYPHWYQYHGWGKDTYGQEGELFTTMDEQVYQATQHLPRTDAAMTDTGAKLVPIAAGGTGCVLIHRRVFEKMPAPWFRTSGATNGDLHFFKKAGDLGFQVWGDPGVVCGHMASAPVGVQAFRNYLSKRMGEAVERTAKAGPVHGVMNANTPDYWDYVHGQELLSGARRNYEVTDQVYAHIVRQLESERPAIVDLGCGRSSTYQTLSQVRPIRYTGIDFSVAAIEDNRRNYPEARWIQADLRGFTPPEGIADLCISSHVIEHLEDPEILLRCMWRVVKPGGFMAVGFPLGELEGTPPGEHVQIFDYERMVSLLSKLGAPVWVFQGDPERPVAAIQKPFAGDADIPPHLRVSASPRELSADEVVTV